MGNSNASRGGPDPGDTSIVQRPLLFHNTHSENIQLLHQKRRARRSESFCKGICFTNRPIAINERVFIKFTEVSTSWSGVLRFGLTSRDPAGINSASLPRYACPDLTNKPGNWAKALGERYAEVNNILCFYVTRNGDVMFDVNGEPKGIFFSGVNTSVPLWGLIDIYGNTISVEILDTQHVMNMTPAYAVDQHLSPALATTRLTPHQSSPSISRPPPPVTHTGVPPVRHHANTNFTALPFHTQVYGRNVRLSGDRTIASRVAEEYCNAYVFTSKPLRCGEKIVIQVLGIDRAYVGGLAFGLSSCDPAAVNQHDLPDDSDNLLDRPEYWVVNKDVSGSAEVGDELSFTLTSEGEVHYGKNGRHVAVLMHVDKTLPLWAFFDVYGNTQKIKILGLAGPQVPRPHRINSSSAVSGLTVALPPSSSDGTPPTLPPRNPPAPVRSNSVPSTSMADISPPEVPRRSHQSPAPPPSLPPPLIPIPSSAPSTGATQSPSSGTGQPNVSPKPNFERQNTVESDNALNTEYDQNECTVCYEKQVDCVLYTCGHMCVCYDCAMDVKQNRGALCPICRQHIKDIIKIFRS